MISKFYSIKEDEGEIFQTKSYQHDASIKERIARVAAFIQQHYIDQESYEDWFFKKNNGSVTFQNKNKTETHRVIKIFCDIDNRLAKKIGLDIFDNPIVIGVEISKEIAYLRKIIRDALEIDFKYYMDPRKGHKKYYLNPEQDPKEYHYYDIIFLERGFCEGIESHIIEKYINFLNSPDDFKEPYDLPIFDYRYEGNHE